MACSSCQASTRLIATASTSSRIPSCSRKLLKVDPLWSVLLRFFLTFITVPFISVQIDACPRNGTCAVQDLRYAIGWHVELSRQFSRAHVECLEFFCRCSPGWIAANGIVMPIVIVNNFDL